MKTGGVRTSIALLAGSWAVYFLLGWWFWRGLVFADFALDYLLDADLSPDVMLGRYWLVDFRHPLFSLVIRPATALFSLAPVSAHARILLVTSLAGALGVLLLHRVLLRAGVTPGSATAFAALYAVSPPQSVFAMVPDTMVFSATALLAVLYVDSLRLPGARRVCAMAIAIAAAGGVTVLNFAYGLAVYAARLPVRRPARAAFSLAILVFAVAALVSVAFVLQSPLAPERTLDRVLSENNTAKWTAAGLVPIAFRAARIVPYVAAHSLVAPELTIVDRKATIRTVPATGAGGGRAVALWICLAALVGAGAAHARTRGRLADPETLRAAAWTAITIGAFAVFSGPEPYLYAPYFAAVWVLLAGVVFGRPAAGRERSGDADTGARGAVWALVFAVCVISLGWIAGLNACLRAFAPS